MATVLGARSSAAPLPTGQVSLAIAGGGGGAHYWPGVWGNLVSRYNAPLYAYEIGVATTERCWWIVAGQTLAYQVGGNYERRDTGLLLFDAGRVQVADLNGVSFFRTADSADASQYVTQLIEGRFFLEAGRTYYCNLVSASSSPNCAYYTGSRIHGGLIGYTVGEGVY